MRRGGGKRLLIIGLTEEAKLALQRSLFQASRSGDAQAVASLLGRGADPNGKLKYEFLDNTPLDYAIYNNRIASARALIEGGARLSGDEAALGFRVILHQNDQLLELLIEAGLDPSAKSLHTGTLLESASGIIGISEEGSNSTNLYPSPEIVDTLLKHGADPGIGDPLYMAVQAQNYSIIQSLLRAGADPYKSNVHGDTPYELSVQRNINRWLTVQKERVILPSFSVTDDEGRLIEEGFMNLRSLNEPQGPVQNVSWTAGKANADIPNGGYRVMNVSAGGKTYRLPKQASITIQDETATPAVLKLPATNVAGKLTSQTIPIDGGRLMVSDSRESWDFLSRGDRQPI